MPNVKNLPELYLEYLNKYKTMSVATVSGKGKPDCSTVYFAYNSSGEIYFCSDRNTTKSKNLKSNDQCAVTFNDGGSTAMGVKLFGAASEITQGAQKILARDALLARVPNIEPFLANPNLAFYRVVPTRKFLINFAWGVDWKVAVE